MANKIDVYGELNSRTGEGKLADASQIWDSTQGKFQDEINQETANDGLVSVKVEQEFTDEEKAQGRENIGAADQQETEVSFPVIAEAMLYLYNENKALRELLTGKDNAVLPYIKAQTIECVDKMTMGVPDVLESKNAGAPNAANVPDNWNETTMGVWDGCTRRIGQQYVDKASGKVYYAIKVTGSTSDWVSLN